MTKVHFGHDGKIITYGLRGDYVANYRRYGVYGPAPVIASPPPKRSLLARLLHR